MFEYKDHRFRYDNDGNVLGPSPDYIAQQQESNRQMARSSSGAGGGAVPLFCVALVALVWAIQELRARFPLWVVLMMAFAVASASAWLIGRKLSSTGDYSKNAVKAIRIGIFLAIDILLSAMICDLNGWGVRVLVAYGAIFLLLMIFGFLSLLVSAVAKNPIGSAIIAVVGGSFFWALFVAKQPQQATTTVSHSSPPQVTARKSGRRHTPKKSTAQSQPESTSPIPGSSVEATATSTGAPKEQAPEDSDHSTAKRVSAQPAAK